MRSREKKASEEEAKAATKKGQFDQYLAQTKTAKEALEAARVACEEARRRAELVISE